MMLRPFRRYYLLAALSVFRVTNSYAVAEEKTDASAVPLRPGPPAHSKPQPAAQSNAGPVYLMPQIMPSSW
jgi:hypothetical protein